MLHSKVVVQFGSSNGLIVPRPPAIRVKTGIPDGVYVDKVRLLVAEDGQADVEAAGYIVAADEQAALNLAARWQAGEVAGQACPRVEVLQQV
jgi:hypothetical protein